MVKFIGNWSTTCINNQKERKNWKNKKKTDEKDTEQQEKCKIKEIQESIWELKRRNDACKKTNNKIGRSVEGMEGA